MVGKNGKVLIPADGALMLLIAFQPYCEGANEQIAAILRERKEQVSPQVRARAEQVLGLTSEEVVKT